MKMERSQKNKKSHHHSRRSSASAQTYRNFSLHRDNSPSSKHKHSDRYRDATKFDELENRCKSSSPAHTPERSTGKKTYGSVKTKDFVKKNLPSPESPENTLVKKEGIGVNFKQQKNDVNYELHLQDPRKSASITATTNTSKEQKPTENFETKLLTKKNVSKVEVKWERAPNKIDVYNLHQKTTKPLKNTQSTPTQSGNSNLDDLARQKLLLYQYQKNNAMLTQNINALYMLNHIKNTNSIAPAFNNNPLGLPVIPSSARKNTPTLGGSPAISPLMNSFDSNFYTLKFDSNISQANHQNPNSVLRQESFAPKSNLATPSKVQENTEHIMLLKTVLDSAIKQLPKTKSSEIILPSPGVISQNAYTATKSDSNGSDVKSNEKNKQRFSSGVSKSSPALSPVNSISSESSSISDRPNKLSLSDYQNRKREKSTSKSLSYLSNTERSALPILLKTSPTITPLPSKYDSAIPKSKTVALKSILKSGDVSETKKSDKSEGLSDCPVKIESVKKDGASMEDEYLAFLESICPNEMENQTDDSRTESPGQYKNNECGKLIYEEVCSNNTEKLRTGLSESETVNKLLQDKRETDPKPEHSPEIKDVVRKGERSTVTEQNKNNEANKQIISKGGESKNGVKKLVVVKTDKPSNQLAHNSINTIRHQTLKRDISNVVELIKKPVNIVKTKVPPVIENKTVTKNIIKPVIKPIFFDKESLDSKPKIANKELLKFMQERNLIDSKDKPVKIPEKKSVKKNLKEQTKNFLTIDIKTSSDVVKKSRKPKSNIHDAKTSPNVLTSVLSTSDEISEIEKLESKTRRSSNAETDDGEDKKVEFTKIRDVQDSMDVNATRIKEETAYVGPETNDTGNQVKTKYLSTYPETPVLGKRQSKETLKKKAFYEELRKKQRRHEREALKDKEQVMEEVNKEVLEEPKTKPSKIRKVEKLSKKLTPTKKKDAKVSDTQALSIDLSEATVSADKEVTYNSMVKTVVVSPVAAKKFRCKTCDSEFWNEKDLSKHMLLHKYRSYKCTKCEEMFTTMRELTKHLLVHDVLPRVIQSTRPHDCDRCGEKFESDNQLLVHLRIHDMKESEHVCTFCSTKYHHLSELYSHISKKHPEGLKQVLNCNECKVSFATLSGFRLHLMNHHNMNAKEAALACRNNGSIPEYYKEAEAERVRLLNTQKRAKEIVLRSGATVKKVTAQNKNKLQKAKEVILKVKRAKRNLENQNRLTPKAIVTLPTSQGPAGDERKCCDSQISKDPSKSGHEKIKKKVGLHEKVDSVFKLKPSVVVKPTEETNVLPTPTVSVLSMSVLEEIFDRVHGLQNERPSDSKTNTAVAVKKTPKIPSPNKKSDSAMKRILSESFDEDIQKVKAQFDSAERTARMLIRNQRRSSKEKPKKKAKLSSSSELPKDCDITIEPLEALKVKVRVKVNDNGDKEANEAETLSADKVGNKRSRKSKKRKGIKKPYSAKIRDPTQRKRSKYYVYEDELYNHASAPNHYARAITETDIRENTVALSDSEITDDLFTHDSLDYDDKYNFDETGEEEFLTEDDILMSLMTLCDKSVDEDVKQRMLESEMRVVKRDVGLLMSGLVRSVCEELDCAEVVKPASLNLLSLHSELCITPSPYEDHQYFHFVPSSPCKASPRQPTVQFTVTNSQDDVELLLRELCEKVELLTSWKPEGIDEIASEVSKDVYECLDEITEFVSKAEILLLPVFDSQNECGEAATSDCPIPSIGFEEKIPNQESGCCTSSLKLLATEKVATNGSDVIDNMHKKLSFVIPTAEVEGTAVALNLNEKHNDSILSPCADFINGAHTASYVSRLSQSDIAKPVSDGLDTSTHLENTAAVSNAPSSNPTSLEIERRMEKTAANAKTCRKRRSYFCDMTIKKEPIDEIDIQQLNNDVPMSPRITVANTEPTRLANTRLYSCDKLLSEQSTINPLERLLNTDSFATRKFPRYATDQINIFSCPLCKKTFLNGEDLSDHSTKHSSTSMNKRCECNSDKSDFKTCLCFGKRKRKKILHKGGYDCKGCEEQFTSLKTLHRHQILKHEIVLPTKCRICARSFLNRSYLLSHMKIKHAGNRKPNKRRVNPVSFQNCISLNTPSCDQTLVASHGARSLHVSQNHIST